MGQSLQTNGATQYAEHDIGASDLAIVNNVQGLGMLLCWVNILAVGSGGTVFGHGFGGSTGNAIRHYIGVSAFGHPFFQGGKQGQVKTIIADNPLTAGLWYLVGAHVSGVSGVMSLYVNAVLQTATASPYGGFGASASADQRITVGALKTTAGAHTNFINCYTARPVQITGIQSQAEETWNYNGGVPRTMAEIIARYPGKAIYGYDIEGVIPPIIPDDGTTGIYDLTMTNGPIVSTNFPVSPVVAGRKGVDLFGLPPRGNRPFNFG